METYSSLTAKPYMKPRLVWVERDTTWDIYPKEEPIQLALFNWEGFWFPQPDGSWYKSPVGCIIVGDANTPSLFGEWVGKQILGPGELKLMQFRQVVV